MKRKYLDERGGAMVLEAVLLALVLVAAGFAVYNFFQHAKQPAAQPAKSVVATKTPAATPTPTNEIKITELGFKMTLPEGLADLKYVAQTNLPGSAEHPATYSTSSYTTTSLEQSSGAGSQCTVGSSAIGSIVKYSEDPKTFATGIAASKRVGNFYLRIITPQQPCTNNPAAEQLETSQIELLRQAFDNATAL